MKTANIRRLVLDSLSSYISGVAPAAPEGEQRRLIRELTKSVKDLGATSLIISELGKETQWFSRDTISEFLVDGIIALRYIEGEESFRTLYVPKMRKTKQSTAIFPMEITRKGVVVHSSSEKKA